MQYVLFACVLMIVCVFGFSCRKGTLSPPVSGQSGGAVAATSGQYLSREDIQKQLAVIAKSPPPLGQPPGAMCYKVAAPPSRIDYVCPTCGEKTLYAYDAQGFNHTPTSESDDPNVVFLSYLAHLESIAKNTKSRSMCHVVYFDLGHSRRLIPWIKKLDIELDESQFCKHCSPNIEEPKIGLIIRYPDQPQPHHVWGVTWKDISMLKEVSKGKTSDGDRALINYLDRLEELLGVTLDDTE